jgi:hypothetical protein
MGQLSSSSRVFTRVLSACSTSLLILLTFSTSLQARDRLRSAWEALPLQLQNGVVKVSADNATATAENWYFIAKNADGKLVSVTTTDGQITQEKRSLDLRELLANPTPINQSKIEAGSAAAWAAAENFAQSVGRTLGTVSYVLTQNGPSAAPIWAIWCYSPDGSYFGLLKMLATDGTVISSQAK